VVVRVVTDLGVDVICAAEDVARVRAQLEAAGAVPVSEAAAEVLRVESGRPRYGVDLDQTVIPQEAGLNERAVSFTKGCYVGQETVARLHYRGKPNRHLRGLRLSATAPPGAELRRGEQVGRRARLGGRLAAPRADRAGARAPRGGARRPARDRGLGGERRGRRAALLSRPSPATF
jgi:folate-binding protein YgfZ